MPGARSGRHICRAAGGQEYKDHIRAARGQPADIKHDPAQPAACSLVTGGEEIMGQVVTSCTRSRSGSSLPWPGMLSFIDTLSPAAAAAAPGHQLEDDH